MGSWAVLKVNKSTPHVGIINHQWLSCSIRMPPVHAATRTRWISRWWVGSSW